MAGFPNHFGLQGQVLHCSGVTIEEMLGDYCCQSDDSE